MSEGTAPLLGLGTWTKQGPATLVRRRSAWAVLVPGTRKPVIEAAWTLLGEDPDPATFLDRLVEAGGLESDEALPGLLHCVHDGTSATLLVKGTSPIAVYTASGVEQVKGTEQDPIVLRTLEDVRRIAFGELPVEEPEGLHRVVEGIIPVRGFVHGLVDPESLSAEDRAALADQVEADGRSIMDPEEKARRATRTPAPAPRSTSGSGSGTGTGSGSGSGGGGSLASRLATADRSSGQMPPSLSSSSSRTGGASRAAAPEPEPSGPNMFADLLGGGSEGSAAPAAPAAEAPDAPEAPATTPASPERTEPAPTTPPAAPASEAPATPAPAPTPAAPAGAAPRRRLVSTSLFDRRPRAAAPAPETPASAPAVPTPAPASSPTAAPSPAPAPAASPAPAPAPSPAPAPARSAATPSEAPRASDHTLAGPLDPELTSPDTLIAPVEPELTSPDTLIAPIDDEDEAGPAEVTPTPRPRRAVPTGTATHAAPLTNAGAYDDLFGRTISRSIEDAAVRPAAEDAGIEERTLAPAEEPSAQGPATHEPAPHEPSPGVSVGQLAGVPGHVASGPSEHGAPAPATSGAEDFIDWVPGVGRAAPEIAQAAARRAAAPHPSITDDEQIQRAGRNRAADPARPVGGQPGPAPTAGHVAAPGQAATPGQPAAPGQTQMPGRAPGPVPAGVRPVGPTPTGAPHRAPTHQAPTHQAPQYQSAQYQGGQHQTPAPQHPAHQTAPSQAPAHQAQAPTPVAPLSASPSGVPGEVSLTGQLCPQGHANPPERDRCRTCGAPLNGPTRTVRRPPLGVALLSTGGRIVLDRSAVIGRRPRASRVSAHEVPQLVTVPSPQQDISRSHVELRLEGWHVLATDLGTTNGTTLHRTGYEPLRLRPREGVVLHDGDVLDLGDGVRLRFGERA